MNGDEYGEIFDAGYDEGSEFAFQWVMSHLEGYPGLRTIIKELEEAWDVVDKDDA